MASFQDAFAQLSNREQYLLARSVCTSCTTYFETNIVALAHAEEENHLIVDHRPWNGVDPALITAARQKYDALKRMTVVNDGRMDSQSDNDIIVLPHEEDDSRDVICLGAVQLKHERRSHRRQWRSRSPEYRRRRPSPRHSPSPPRGAPAPKKQKKIGYMLINRAGFLYEPPNTTRAFHPAEPTRRFEDVELQEAGRGQERSGQSEGQQERPHQNLEKMERFWNRRESEEAHQERRPSGAPEPSQGSVNLKKQRVIVGERVPIGDNFGIGFVSHELDENLEEDLEEVRPAEEKIFHPTEQMNGPPEGLMPNDEPRYWEQKMSFAPFEEQKKEFIRGTLHSNVMDNFIGNRSGPADNYDDFVSLQVQERKVFTFSRDHNGQQERNSIDFPRGHREQKVLRSTAHYQEGERIYPDRDSGHRGELGGPVYPPAQEQQSIRWMHPGDEQRHLEAEDPDEEPFSDGAEHQLDDQEEDSENWYSPQSPTYGEEEEDRHPQDHQRQHLGHEDDEGEDVIEPESPEYPTVDEDEGEGRQPHQEGSGGELEEDDLQQNEVQGDDGSLQAPEAPRGRGRKGRGAARGRTARVRSPRQSPEKQGAPAVGGARGRGRGRGKSGKAAGGRVRKSSDKAYTTSARMPLRMGSDRAVAAMTRSKKGVSRPAYYFSDDE